MARFAVKTPTHHTTWDRMLEIWRAADEMDVYESAWNFDHFYPIRGDSDGPCLEAWVTLSALAQATNRIRVGTMVNGMHYRHPAVTAAMASSLDIVSGGRLELGLGAGWYELESDAYGIELGTIGERMTRFEEGTEVIHLLLTQEHTDFEGKFFRLDNARNEPKPVQQPRPPIVIGGKGRSAPSVWWPGSPPCGTPCSSRIRRTSGFGFGRSCGAIARTSAGTRRRSPAPAISPSPRTPIPVRWRSGPPPCSTPASTS